MSDGPKILAQMNDRSREVFRRVVEGYLDSGDPIGSRSLTRAMTEKLSAATIRNVMQDLEFLGLLDSPHISAGRIPTQLGLRMFVDGLMEVSSVTLEDRQAIDATMGNSEPDVGSSAGQGGGGAFGNNARRQSGADAQAGSPDPPHRVRVAGTRPGAGGAGLRRWPGREPGFCTALGQTPSSMREAGNFLNALAEGRTLSELRLHIRREIASRRQELNDLARDLVESGLALWENPGESHERLIVRGQSNLLDQAAEADLTRIRSLFDDLERKRDIADFLELAESGEGVRIFIGSENKLFSLSGSSLVVSPYMNADRKIIGAVGVIGPTRLNYGRIVPIVDYTAQLVGRLVSDRGQGLKTYER